MAVFANIDIDAGGTIDQVEIYEALLEAGVEISEEGVATFFNMIDEDGSGEIDQEEWKEAADFYLELKEEEKIAVSEESATERRQNNRAAKLRELGNSTLLTKKEKLDWKKSHDKEPSKEVASPTHSTLAPEMLRLGSGQSPSSPSRQSCSALLGPKAKTIRFSEVHNEEEGSSWHPLEEASGDASADNNDTSDNPLDF